MARQFAAGIDLHGTLLDPGWQVPPALRNDLVGALEYIRPVCELFLCTGNDLTFVYDHLGHELPALFDGFVLETGCVVSHGNDEEILVPDDVLSKVKELEMRLQEAHLPGVQYFGRRLATISLFTKTEAGGADPAHLYPRVKDEVQRMGYGEDVLVTHSDVAVDIIPGGFNKYTGLRQATEAPVLIGIADSLNDLHLIESAEMAFLPANASPALLKELHGRGREVFPIETCTGGTGRILAQSALPHTGAVIDVLRFLGQHLQ
jgi:hydroxymethylpyrimidine pyrophosphatase-like HAD family hydrolase